MKRFMSVVLAFLLFLSSGCGAVGDGVSVRDGFGSKLAVLSEEVKKTESFREFVSGRDFFTVFLSVSDGEHRCKVYCGRGGSFDAAVDDAKQARLSDLGENETKYLKLDILLDTESISGSDLFRNVYMSQSNAYRKSIAFDGDFGHWLLDSELNSCGLWDYDTGALDLDYLNAYFSACGRDMLASLPADYIEFTTLGYFCDGDDRVYELGHDADMPGYGRRVDADFNAVLENAGDYLRKQVRDDGRFVYGYIGYDNYEIEDYNILRHAGTAWSLMNYYRYSGNEDVMLDVDSVMDYLLSQVVYHGDMAFIYDAENGGIKLGSSGLGLIALVNYIELSGRQDLIKLCRQLADGILYCLDADFTFNHVYDSDLNLIEKTRTVYYDGEATYGLCRLYDLTGDTAYLDAVEKIIKNNFIANGYETIGDHWVAYTLDCFLKSRWDQEIFDFALRNVSKNLETWEKSQVARPARFEACANLLDLYGYAVEQGHLIPAWFDADMRARFGQAADYLLGRTLDGLFWPEVAMYQGYPERVTDGFFDRTDAFRTRIDDTQHSYNGLLVYLGLSVVG